MEVWAVLCLAVLKLYKAMHSWQKIKESNPSEVIQQPGSPPACPLAGRGLCGGGPPASAVLIWEREAVRNLASADEASVARAGWEPACFPGRAALPSGGSAGPNGGVRVGPG